MTRVILAPQRPLWSASAHARLPAALYGSMLKHLKRVVVQFNPADKTAAAARELLARVSTSTAKLSNPKCQVDYKVDEDLAQSFVELHFNNDEVQKLMTADVSAKDIQRIIELKSQELEIQTVFKEVGANCGHTVKPQMH